MKNNEILNEFCKDFIIKLEEKGIIFQSNFNKICFKGPKNILTESDKKILSQYKEAFLNFLNNRPAIKTQKLPLSFAQKRLWFLQQLNVKSTIYNVPIASKLLGHLNIEALKKSLQALMDRHALLRSTFHYHDNEPFQSISSNKTLDFTIKAAEKIDEEKAELYLSTAAKTPFDFERGSLFSALLITDKKSTHYLLLNMHHLIIDGWSLKILAEELHHFYNHFSNNACLNLPKLKHDYFDFISMEAAWLKKNTATNQLNYWVDQLKNLPTLSLNTDYSRPQKLSYQGDMENHILSKSILEQLTIWSKKEGVTNYISSLTALFILLFYYSNQEDIVTATPVSTRNYPGLDQVLGTFMNTLVLRLKVEPILTFHDILLKVKELVVEAFDNQDLPFDQIVEALQPERRLNLSPLFQVLFLYENFPKSIINLNGLHCETINIPLGTARFDILFLVAATKRGLEISVEYSTELFKPETIRKFIQDFETILNTMITKPQTKLNDFSLHGLAKDIKAESFVPNDFQAIPFIDTFRMICKTKGSCIALIEKDRSLSYQEVDRLSDNIACFMQEQGVQKNDRIILCLPNSIEAVLSILATLKCGAAFVPIDARMPAKRLESMVQQIKPALIVTHKDSEDNISRFFKACFRFEDMVAVHKKNPRQEHIALDDLAYIIFTSGSTGLAKGVEVDQLNLANLSYALEERIYQSYPYVQTIGLNGPLFFDTSIKQLIQLLKGRTLHIFTEAIRYDSAQFIHYLVENHIQLFDCTPSQCRLLIEAGLHQGAISHRMVVLVGGEAIDTFLWQELKRPSNINYFNLYGPTECTVDVSCAAIKDFDKPTLGYPLANIEIYLLDEQLKPVSEGAEGEMYISGLSVAKGYYEDPVLTRQRFLPNPFNPHFPTMYRSGDRGLFLKNGALQFLGRMDAQIKHNGYRIEAGDIEQALQSHPLVKQAVVLLKREPQRNLLCAYVETDISHMEWRNTHKRYRLPNGLAIAHLNKHETDFLYRDIFEKNAYLRHGIHLEPESVVFDIGSNIGLFVLQAHFQAENIKFYTFEPNPFVAELLNENIRFYGLNAKQFTCALGSQTEVKNFTYYPKMSFLSGLYGNSEEEKALVHSYMKLNAQNTLSMDTTKEILDHHLATEQFNIQIKTLSSIIAEEKIKKIDLLKINVEKAELDVLKGIIPSDWEKIKQIVVEIHNQDGRLNLIENLLAAQGFTITIEEDWSVSKEQAIYYLYASRQKQCSAPKAVIIKTQFLKEQDLNNYLKQYLPHYMLPDKFHFIEKFPLTPNGKIDHNQLLSMVLKEEQTKSEPQTVVQNKIAAIWKDVLKIEKIHCEDNFFDLGGHSLLLTAVRDALNRSFTANIQLMELFEYTNIKSLAERIEQNHIEPSTIPIASPSSNREKDIAIIGFSGRFPQSKNPDIFWQNLLDNKELISYFENTTKESNYVGARGIIEDIEYFDADFFGFNPRDAERLDPQQRIFLECSWEAFEHAGYVPEQEADVGIFAGQSISTYLVNHILPSMDQQDPIEAYQSLILNDKDHLASRIAYTFNLKGPSLTIQTACSTSLSAVHMACQAIQNGDCTLALAGGVSIVTPYQEGYIYREGGILSADGHCRAFDNHANGTVPANGAGVVLLKSLKQAIQDNDTIHAVILGSAINNDGHQKMGYTAPSIQGQAAVIQKALAKAKISAETISYIEAHGTGTALGDPIEMSALERVFSNHLKPQTCPIGSVKTNIGHLDAAAGIASLIKVTLAMKEKIIPASLHFKEGNTNIQWEKSPFYFVEKNIPWISKTGPIRAGINAFGIGGTNVHLILEQAPIQQISQCNNGYSLFILSARTRPALQELCQKLLEFLNHKKDYCMQDIAYTLQVGRKHFAYRYFFICQEYTELFDHLNQILTNQIPIRYIDEGTKKPLADFPELQGYFLENHAAKTELPPDIDQKSLLNLGYLWSLGAKINWSLLPMNAYARRVPLPTYPFERKRYWLDKVSILKDETQRVGKSSFISLPQIEEKLMNIWKKYLGLANFNIRDDYYQLGGNSLIALQLTEEIMRQFAIKLLFSELLSQRTVENLAKFIHDKLIQNNKIQGVKSKLSTIEGIDLKEELGLLKEEELDALLEELTQTQE